MDERDKSTQAEVEPANESVDVGKPSSTVEIETDILSQHKTLASQVGQGNSNNSSGTLGDGSEQMKIFVTNANVTYHTRHARRIYVGGIPPNYSDEEELRNFFNKVISKGLGVENDHSFVISVYMNQKKCYAFVEFSSIELTTACLEMDGIIFKKVTLKIYRANEYRPDLVPPAKFLKLDLSGWSFGLATGAGAPGSVNGTNPALNNPNYPRPNSQSGISPTSSWVAEEPPSPVQLNDCIASLIQFTNIASMEPGSLAIVGFPYESGTAKPHARTPQRGVGTSACPACLRKSLTTYAGAMIYNAELGLDLSLQPIMDVGDVLAGQSRNETKALLSTTISELLLRGSVPFLVGGSRDQTYYSAMGLVAATGVCVGVMNVSAQVDGKILDCPEFCTPTSLMQGAGRANNVSPTRSQNCYGRYVQFGAQGAQCNGEIAKSIVDRGGHIFWLHKDLRNASTESIAVAQFNRALRNLDACVLHDQQRKGLNTAALRNAYPQAFIMVSVDCGVLAGMFNPLAGSSCSSLGLTAEEVLEIAYIAGAHPNVALFEITEFRPDMDSESRMNMFLADVFYKFALGVASRTQPLRGGALGAGAVALTSGVSSVAISPTAGAVPVPGGVQAQYGGRTPTAAAANLKRGPGVGGVGGGYTPSRDPAIILQQQQQQQQQQYQQQMLQQQAQPPVPGRIPYTPQQLQIQQQHLQQQQQLAMMNRTNQAAQLQQPLQQPPQQRGGVPAFPSGVSEAGLNAQNGNRGFAPAAQRGSLTQSPSLNGSYYHLDDALSVTSGGNDFSLNGSLHSLQLSQSSQAQSQHAQTQNGYQTGTRAATNYGNAFAEEDTSYARGLNHRPSPIVTQTASNNALDSAGSASSLFGHAASNNNSFYRSQQGNGSLLNPSAPTFQSDNKWSNYGVSSASAGTPASQATHSTAVPSFPSGADWMAAQGDSSRYSAFTNSSTSSLTLGNPSTSFHHAHSQHSTPHHAPSVFAAQSNGHNHNYSNSTGSSSLRGQSSLPELTGPYEDAMDKLIGVTNIGHIPSFDDPHDPQYQED